MQVNGKVKVVYGGQSEKATLVKSSEGRVCVDAIRGVV